MGTERFSFSDTTTTSAYHKTVAQGGADLRNRCVRIGFVKHPVTRKNEIIWLVVGRASACKPTSELASAVVVAVSAEQCRRVPSGNKVARVAGRGSLWAPSGGNYSCGGRRAAAFQSFQTAL